jgi:hypothetical protein
MVMIGEPGCERLAMDGDALLKTATGIRGVQGAYISEKDVDKWLQRLTYSGTGERKFTIDPPLAAVGASGGCEPKRSAEDEFDNNLAAVIMLLLRQGKISNDEIQGEIEVGFKKANLYMDKLVEFGLIPPPDKKRRPRKLLAKSATEIQSEVKDFLAEHGYTHDDVEEAFVN